MDEGVVLPIRLFLRSGAVTFSIIFFSIICKPGPQSIPENEFII